MSLGACGFEESSDRPNLTKSCAGSHRTLTLGVRNVLLFGGNVYAEDEIYRTPVNREQLFSCLRICVGNIAGKTSIKY